jgi:hypothetical protein
LPCSIRAIIRVVEDSDFSPKLTINSYLVGILGLLRAASTELLRSLKAEGCCLVLDSVIRKVLLRALRGRPFPFISTGLRIIGKTVNKIAS